MGANVLPEIRKCGEDAHTSILAAVEGVTIVQALVGTQPVQRGERLAAAIILTGVRLLLGMDPQMNLERVGCEEGLATSCCQALEPVLSSVCLEVCAQVAGGAVGAVTALVGAVEAACGGGVSGWVAGLDGECGMAWFFRHLHSRLTWVDVHHYLILPDGVLDVPETKVPSS